MRSAIVLLVTFVVAALSGSCATTPSCVEGCRQGFSDWVRLRTGFSEPTMRFSLEVGIAEIPRSLLHERIQASEISTNLKQVLLAEIEHYPDTHEPIDVPNSGLSAPGIYNWVIFYALESGNASVSVGGNPIDRLRYRDVEYGYKSEREYFDESGILLLSKINWIA